MRLPSGLRVPDGRPRLVWRGRPVPTVVPAVALLVVSQVRSQSPIQDAVAAAPAGTKRVSFTDWAAVRQRVEGSDGAVPARRVARLLSRGYDRDLTSASSISEAGTAMAAKLGFGPGNASWEAYDDAPAGAAMVLRMDDSVDFGSIERRLRSAGFSAPSDEGGVWRGGPDLISQLDPTLTPEAQYVALDAGRHLVVSSDSPSYAETAAAAAAGDGRTLTDSEAGSTLRALAGRGELALASAVLWAGDYACSDLSMSQAAASDQQAAQQLVDRLGGVSPLTGLVIGEQADGDVRVVMGFESSDQAVDNLRPRAQLVVGEDPSRPQSIGQTYRLTRSRTEGDAVLLDLRARPDVGAGLTTLTSGPVLFATC